MNNVVLNKIQSIQRCIRRAREEYEAAPDDFDVDFTRQDAAVLNVLRACEQAIDLANHVIRTKKLGVPSTSAESFELLQTEGVIDESLADKLKKMVGFRNAIVHHYQRMELAVVRSVITVGLNDLVAFGDQVLAYLGEPDK